jgi:hypothetical protein
VLSGTPAAGGGGTYPITITASNGTTPNATQAFTLTVDQAPAITSAASYSVASGVAGSFTVTASGFPAPSFTETGALPTGVALSAAGVLTVASTTAPGTTTFTITASNGIGTPATQSFTLTVASAATVPGVPTKVSATAGNASATVSWAAPSNNGGSVITSYTITPIILVNGLPQTPTTVSSALPALTVVISGLTNGTAYAFTVAATNAIGTGPVSAQSNSVTPSASNLLPQTITFGTPAALNVGYSETITATASSGLAVAFTSATPGVCSVGATTLTGTTSTATATGLGAGSCTIDANQNGNTIYAPAPQVAQSFAVTVGTQTPVTACEAPQTCDLLGSAGNPVLPHTIQGGSKITGTVSETVCLVAVDPRWSNASGAWVYTAVTLPVSQVCPGYGGTVLPAYLSGGSGASGHGFAIAKDTNTVDPSLKGALVYTTEYPDALLPPPSGGSNPSCQTAIIGWAPLEGEGSYLAGDPLSPGVKRPMLAGNTSCSPDPGRTHTSGLSLYGIGLVLNTAGIPSSLPNMSSLTTATAASASPNPYKVLVNSEYLSLASAITNGVSGGEIARTFARKLLTCVGASAYYYVKSDDAKALADLAYCDSEVSANEASFTAKPSSYNPSGEMHMRIRSLYYAINTWIVGTDPATWTWPVPVPPALYLPLSDH